jgi:hypothetical protein
MLALGEMHAPILPISEKAKASNLGIARSQSDSLACAQPRRGKKCSVNGSQPKSWLILAYIRASAATSTPMP